MNNLETITIEYAEIGCPRYNRVIGKIKRAATLARKNGLPEPKVLSEKEFTTKQYCAFGREYAITNVKLKLDRKLVKIDGYRLIAQIDVQGVISRICHKRWLSDEDLNVLREDRKACYVHCDHCGKARRRKMVIICQHKKTGELKSFGRNCLEIITGVKLTDSFLDANAFNLNEDDIAFGAMWREGKVALSIARVLLVGSAIIKQDGFVSRRDAEAQGRPSTSDIVKQVLANPEETMKLLDGHSFNTKSIIGWVKNSTNTGNYMTNLKISFESKFVGERYVGYIVSAIASKQNEDNRKSEAKLLAVNEHVGEVGQRMYKKDQVNAEVVFAKVLNNNWGVTTLLKFKTTAGHILTWFASGYLEVDNGDKCVISGATIKGHKEFNGIKETSVNRVKLEWA